MEEGTIQVRVYSSRAKIPVTDATVLIKHHILQEKESILALEVTNTSGYTRKVTLPTPTEDASTSPTEEPVSTLLDIWVEHPSFVTQKIEGVSLYPATNTLLPVELFPLSEGASSLVEETQVELSTPDL